MGKSNRKKLRITIFLRIALLFIAALILSSLLIFFVSYNYMMNCAAREAKSVAELAASMALREIGERNAVTAMQDDEELRREMHDSFQDICRRAGLKYLYLYRLNEEKNKQYFVVAAKDDEDDARANENYGYGSIEVQPPYDAEIRILDGASDGQFEFIKNEYGWVCMYVLPVYSDTGDLIALIGADYSIERIRGIAFDNLKMMLIIGSLVIACTYFIALLLIRQLIIIPVHLLSGRMKSFVEDRKNKIQAQPRKSLLDDEITDIEDSFDEMADDISRYVEDIEALISEKTLNQTQLAVARNIQLGIIPQEQGVSGDNYETYGCMYPAREVGGDFYDIFTRNEREVCIVIADISGKGVSAALFMTMVRTIIRENLMAGIGVADTLNRANNELCASNPENMFATTFAAILDLQTGVLRYANGGHNAPLFLSGKVSWLKMHRGVALGMFPDVGIVEEELKLGDGEGLLMYTDGVTEAINPEMEQFGEERLKDTVSQKYREGGKNGSPRTIVQTVIDAVGQFAGSAEQFDDITCTAFLFHDHTDGTRTLTPEMASFRSVKDMIRSSLGADEHTNQIILACEEMFVNIVNYSGADQVSFSCDRTAEICTVVFVDNGIPFDPVTAQVREKEFEELDQGGMGIKLARMYSKEMLYSRRNERNVLTMRFDCPKTDGKRDDAAEKRG
ncbi:MAG: SpoIIE family protein phosphatase [Lachnospiraceae bacterium]|nr:SpoIIE family protein phosphatase [Lachnospiraceae bacterium]